MQNKLSASILEEGQISDFFKELSANDYQNFEELIETHSISCETLLPFAKWKSNGYNRICLAKNPACELVLICWNKGNETAVHDHDNQECCMYFAKGDFIEKQYAKGDGKELIEEREILEGSVSTVEENVGFHSLHYNSSGLGMTLHLYANPIHNCQVYCEDKAQFEKKNLVYDFDLTERNEIDRDLCTFLNLAQDLLDDEKENPISERISADLLKKTLGISLEEEAISEATFVETLKKVVLATPKTSSTLFFNQLFGGRESKAVLGDLLAVMLNNSMYTYKVGGVQVGIEKEIINQVIARIDYGVNAGGTIPVGGSMSNFKAMLMARDMVCAESRHQGVTSTMIAYTSAESHYSIEKNAAFVGIGRNNVRKIPANDVGEMDINLLEKAIEEDIAKGNTPFFVNATAGTTVLGAFDDFVAIRKLTAKHKMWMHIDGAYKGSVVLSDKYKHLIKEVNQADSFSFNPHKMLGTPLTCSILVVKDKKHLHDSFSNNAEYLYQTDEDDYNLGKTSFQCGRRNDALKLWTLWKSKGRKGLEEIINKQFELADFARNYIKKHPDYTLYSFDNSISICFNYKNIPANQLCTDLYNDNQLMVGYGQFRETEFVRMVTINHSNSTKNIEQFFAVIENQ